MSDLRVTLIAVDDARCKLGRVDLKVLMKRALRVEKRMETKVMIEDEQRRYNTYCDRIEFFGHRLLGDASVRSCELSSEYLNLMDSMVKTYPEEASNMRLTASFCDREQVSTYIKQFEILVVRMGIDQKGDIVKKREFYKEAETNGCSVVELVQAWIPESTEEQSQLDIIDSDKLREEFLSLNVADSITLDKRRGPFVSLIQQFDQVIEQTKNGVSGAINFSELGHNVIAEIIHDYVYKAGEIIKVPVIYADGSQANPLSLFCLRLKKDKQMKSFNLLPVLKVGMMSARHSNEGLDVTVSTYWFRNQEISIGRTQAETDKIAFEKSRELFFKMRSEGPVRIAFYQTGFQPAVVGFYRALTEELVERNIASLEPSLEVIPYYFLRGGYEIGKIWN